MEFVSCTWFTGEARPGSPTAECRGAEEVEVRQVV